MEKAFSSFLLTVLLFLHYAMASSAMTYTNGTTDQLALLSLNYFCLPLGRSYL
ncbi:hypothetical protein P3S67_021252 [Capsicum chacoense]